MQCFDPIPSISRRHIRSACLAGAFILIGTFGSRLSAQWSGAPGVNNQLTANSSIRLLNAGFFSIASDGAGGAIAVWTDTRNNPPTGDGVPGSNGGDLWGQRLGSDGQRLWGDNGTAVCDVPGTPLYGTVEPDGNGGVFVAWWDQRLKNGTVVRSTYAQRLNSAGQPQWAPNGIEVHPGGIPGLGSKEYYALLNDGAGGVYIAGSLDTTTPTPPVIFRLSGNGQTATGWPATGLDLGIPNHIAVAKLVTDTVSSGAHGAWAVVSTFAGGVSTRRVNANATLGPILTTLGSGERYEDSASDGQGGLVVLSANGNNLFLSRIKNDGTPGWPASARQISGSATAKTNPYVVTDGAGGALVTWTTMEANGAASVYVQRVSADGAKLWPGDGVQALTTASGASTGLGQFHGVVSDGAGGVIVTLHDFTPVQVRAQRISGSGAKLWDPNGVVVSSGASGGYVELVSDGSAGAIYVLSTVTIGAKRTTASGVLGTPPPATFARLSNLSILTQISSPGDNFTMGYVVGGAGTTGTKPILIRAAGPTLGAAPLNVPGTLTDPRVETYVSSTKTGENDNWGGSSTLSNAFAAVGAFPYLSTSSLDAAVLANISAGDNSVRVAATGNGTGTTIAELYDSTALASMTATTPRLINVSVLKHLGAKLTAGFVIDGTGTKRVLIRVVGPTIGAAPFNVAGAVADPQLTLFSAQTSIASNDNWNGTAELTAAFTQVGAFALPPTSKDSALLATLNPGSYTVEATGVGGTTGMAIVEVYEVP